MEHIYFEAQLCSEIAVFKEKHVFGILIILALLTGLIPGIVQADFLTFYCMLLILGDLVRFSLKIMFLHVGNEPGILRNCLESI